MGRTVREFLIDLFSPSLTPEDVLLSASSPQNMALLFLENDPIVTEDICTYPTLEQRYALVTLYYSTSGAEWTDNTGWVTATRECEWFGVVCEGDFIMELSMRKCVRLADKSINLLLVSLPLLLF
jgi:hypothetical protein